MTQTIEATYQGGIFKPEGDVSLNENQRVRLTIQPIVENMDALEWLERVQRHRQEILDRRGGEPFPDSAPETAEDRMREV